MHKWLAMISVFMCLELQAQDSIHVYLDKKISGVFTVISPDGLGNLLAVTKSGQLRKYNDAMDSVAVYNNLKQLGRLQTIASFNALRTGVYFGQFKTILVLDRFLREINRIDLRKMQLYQVSAVGQSYDNKWWVFDEQDAKLKKISDAAQIELETSDLRILLGENISPEVLFDQQRNIYVYDPSKGVYIFDQLGAFRKKVALLGWKDVQPFGNGFVGVHQGKLMVYANDKFDINSYQLPVELLTAKSLSFASDGCYALYADSIVKFKWNLK